MRKTMLGDVLTGHARPKKYQHTEPFVTCPFCSQNYPTSSLQKTDGGSLCPCGALLTGAALNTALDKLSDAFKFYGNPQSNSCCS